ncbi:MAG: hypothetical protein OHK0022_12760 [Roseiflexaceae bacterium]
MYPNSAIRCAPSDLIQHLKFFALALLLLKEAGAVKCSSDHVAEGMQQWRRVIGQAEGPRMVVKHQHAQATFACQEWYPDPGACWWRVALIAETLSENTAAMLMALEDLWLV